MSERESMEYDVVIVGAGPGGLATAIRLKQLAAEQNQEISVCVLEKGAEVGAHILSGAVMDPRALSELIPDWKEKGAPLNVPVSDDQFLFLTADKARSTPSWMLPDCFKNEDNYVVRLGEVTQWLGEQAEALEVDVFPGFAAVEVLYTDDGAVRGIVTGDMGVARDGSQKPDYQPGMELRIDVATRSVTLPDGRSATFELDAFAQTCLLEGVDQLGYLLKHDPAISAFEQRFHTHQHPPTTHQDSTHAR